jgi:ABC-type polar amino acid transport system ATPase subunit
MTVVMVTHERALAEQYVQRLVFLADARWWLIRPTTVFSLPQRRREMMCVKA